MNRPTFDHRRLEEEAALWLIRRGEPDWSPAQEDELAEWLQLSMRHRAAFWRLEKGWREADRVTALGAEMPALRRRRSAGWRLHGGRARQAMGAYGPALVGALSLAAIGLWWAADILPLQPQPTEYQTAVGTISTVAMPDGSHIQMNTGTRIHTASNPHAREAWLDYGEAFFDIAHRPDERFIVHAGPRTITVLGTRFTVRREGADVTVAVISGRVRVEASSPAAGMVHRAELTTGEVSMSRKDAAMLTITTPAKVEMMTAWRQGMIIFDDTPLSDAVAEFNRYTKRTIHIEDPAIGMMRVGGSFRTSDRAAFISLLHKAYGIRVRESAAETILSR